ncbi:hypothetical protein J4E83_004678 [Alternaria metachromatica]|uniref:uncharacterized protein n=1 Tax=Alternaria metachromatica TaxID=283354 RepID=UPI0020C4730A|nr:uncharacterized protein J4E83_004678 [Alternaria metachromatica]KAI4623285.1 hypothetical protein J4E83_004678 [Alternaria metachromatica]
MRRVPRTAASPTPTTRVLRSQTKQAASEAQATKVTKPSKKRRPRADPWAKKRKPNPNPRPRKPPPTHFTCRICIEEQLTDEFVKWVPPKRGRWQQHLDVPFNCIAHLARNPSKRKIDPVCKTCIGNFLSAKMDTLGVRQLGAGCLEPGCTEPWDHHFILRYMPPGDALEKFNMEMLEVWKETASPKPMTCLSPTCTAIGLPDATAAGYPQVACNDCAFRSCAQCLVPWHKDVTCAEYAAKHVDEKMSDAEKETLKLMQGKDGKRCPNCQLVIEKDGGCDSMFCVGCHKYFNWASAASALTGAKKAEAPYIRDMPYWLHDGMVVCEMDGINGLDGTTGAVAAASDSVVEG